MTIFSPELAKLRQGNFSPAELFDLRFHLTELQGYGFNNLSVEDLLREVLKDIKELEQ
jgi:predicted component of type VI protein secretion system